MGLCSILKCGFYFFVGFYFGYRYCEGLNAYGQALQKVQQPHNPINPEDDDNDNQTDSSSSSNNSFNVPHEYQFPASRFTVYKSSGESNNLKSSSSSSGKSSDSDSSSKNGYMGEIMSVINLIGSVENSPESSSNEPSDDEAKGSTSPIVVPDSDDSNVQTTSSIIGRITTSEGFPLGVVMVSRPTHPSSGDADDESDNSDGEVYERIDACERYNCFD